jgi:hypothetical protein
MAEKTIHEIRFIETDDGFRIEIKGDKKRMREMGFGPGIQFGRHHHHPRGWGFHPGFGKGFDFGPWWQDKPEPQPEHPP